ncbi:O-antigen ligase family protein [uncultured Dubosiella sp.]|uniref:O-antigen ligase family protein n=1 Tax=uncultured Dubosiella sp. TaxID=1937011 RepID=UPI0032B21937
MLILIFLWLPAYRIFAFIPGDIKTIYVVRSIIEIFIIIPHFKLLKNKKILLVIAYIILLCISELINYKKYVHINDLIYTIEHSLYILSMFVFFMSLNRKDWKLFFDDIKIVAIIYIMGTIAFSIPYIGASNIEELGIEFFVGSRAQTVQCLALLITLLLLGDYLYNGKPRILSVILLLISILITVFYHSGQGMVTWCFIGMMQFLLRKNKNLLSKVFSPVKVMGVTLILNVIIVFQIYQKIPLIVWLITVFLKKDISITGRSQLYSYLPSLYDKSPIWGFGYNNTVVSDALSSIQLGWNSAHNSLGIVMFESGVVGLVAYLFVLYMILKVLFNKYDKDTMLIYSLFIGFMISGIVSGVLVSNYYWMICAIALGLYGRSSNSIYS